MVRSFALVLGLAALSAAHATAQVGPDTFGYYAYSSSDLGGPVYSWIEIGSSGTLVATGDDASSVSSALNAPVTLGAPFTFYGTTYTSLIPTTNGYISTDPTDTGPDLSNDCPLPRTPSTGGGARIYPLHDDLISEVRYQYFASSPAQHWSGEDLGVSVFQWNAEHYPTGSNLFFAFEVLIFDNGDIVYQYATGNPELGSGSTTGVQDATASIGLTFACNVPQSIPENFAVLVTRTPPPVDGNAQLVAKKATFAINWAAHALGSPEDTLSLQLLFHPSGMLTDLTGATLRIALRGSEILPASTLDAAGALATAPGVSPSYSARVDAKGNLRASFAGLDLRAISGLLNQTGEGLVDLPLEVEIAGAGLLQEVMEATITFSYSAQLDRATKGTAAFAKSGNLTPVFLPLKIKATEVPGVGHVVQISKALLQFPASAPALPIDLAGVTADVRVEIGTALPIEIPFDSLRVRGEGTASSVDYVATQLDVVGLSRLSVKNSSRALSITTGPLAGTGLPPAQIEGAPLEHDLRLGLLFHTSLGPMRAYATVRMHRSDAASGTWSNTAPR